jgi:choline dehydrogenase-like flavoprotein
LLFDISELELGAEVRSRVCIVGAGAAGITLARKLAAQRIEVLLLEAGGLRMEPNIQALYQGETGAVTYVPLESARLRFLGGTTNHWTGQSVPLDATDFQARSWVPDSGWPIAYDEYVRYLSEARSICEVPEGTFDYGRAARDYGVLAFPKMPDLEPVLLRFSPGTRFGERYRADLEASTYIRCCLHASCLALQMDSTGQRVVMAEVGSLDGRRIRVFADCFVLAAGCIENSRLLLLSRRPSGVAVGNEHDLVGRFFMEHPYVDLYHTTLLQTGPASYFSTASLHLNGSRARRDARFEYAVQAREGLLNHTFHFRFLPNGAPDESVGEQLTRLWNRVNAKVFGGERRGNYLLRIRLEHAPYADSRITLIDVRDELGLQRVKVDLRFGELELRTIQRVQERVARSLGSAGFGRCKLDLTEGVERWAERAGWQYHHMGGTRMHHSPRRGVVDPNCRVHGTTNLYVAGSSVFPTSGHANPTMNLVALTLRLGDHLTKELTA